VASLRLGAALTLAFSLGGCAVSGSLFSKSGQTEARAYANEDTTGSVERTAATSAALPAEADLAFARKAVVDVLTRGTKEISSPWENPASGARGTVTPVASSYAKDGATCREFLASYVRRQGAEVWMQGQACRPKQGAWEVKNMRPWSRT
jgi:surface antigen